MKATGYALIASPFLALAILLFVLRGWKGLLFVVLVAAAGLLAGAIMIKGFDLIDRRER